MNESLEQEARDLLERLGVDFAQHTTSGDLVELANIMSERNLAIILLRSWCAGNGDERFVSKEVVRELLEQTGIFLQKFPLKEKVGTD